MNLEQLLAMGLTQEQAEKIIADNKAAIEQAEQAKQAELDRVKANRDEILSEKKSLQAKQDAELAEKAKLEQDKAKAKGDIEALEAQYKAELAKHEQKYADLVKANNTKFIESTAKDIARSLATNDINAELLQTLIQGRITIDENGVPRILVADGQPSIATIDDFKSEIKSSGRYDALIVGTGASGVGSQGQGTQGTKQASDYTESERIELATTNPNLFNQLFAQKE